MPGFPDYIYVFKTSIAFFDPVRRFSLSLLLSLLRLLYAIACSVVSLFCGYSQCVFFFFFFFFLVLSNFIKLSLGQAMKAQRGSRGIALLFL
jgi:hypothetical protein